MDYLSRVEAFIKENNMILSGDVIAAGVSGGADSVCLLLMLHLLSEKMDFKLFAVNVEHGIRGEESRADSEFVKELCRDIGLSCYIYNVNVPELAKTMKLSVEEAARKARYDAFADACGKYGAYKVAVAHNSDDNAETVIHNMARGTSLSGILGIRPVRDNIIRPLLCMTREEIEDYLKGRGQGFRTDSTNLCDDYTRNKIRHHIIPELKRINPGALDHIRCLSEDVGHALDYLRDVISHAIENIANKEEGEWRVHIPSLTDKPDHIQREVIRRLISDIAGGSKDIGRIHVQSCLSLAESESGSRIDLAMGVEAEREYDHLIIKKKAVTASDEKPEILIPVALPGETSSGKISLRTSFRDKNTIKITKKTYTKWIDCDKIKGGLFLRHRRTGDMLVINEEGGRISIKDYFINEKIPRKLRDEIWLLCDADQVIWVVGYRLSEAFKVREDTGRVLELDFAEK